MNTYEYKEAVEAAVASSNFHEAFRLLRVMLPADAWVMRGEVDSIVQDYRRLLDFALSGAPDPGRNGQLSAIATRIYGVLDMLLRESLVTDHSSLYFNVLRTSRLRRGESVASLIADYSKAAEAVGAFALASVDKSEAAARRRIVEDLEERVFDRIWTTTPLSVDDAAAIGALIDSDVAPESAKLLAVSALTMSLLQFFNERSLRLLLGFAAGGRPEQVKVRATVGSILVMARWPRRSDTTAVRAILDTLREQESWSLDAEQTVMQIIRTADVDKITKTMREEIIPRMMKLRPDIEKHISEVGFDPSAPELNPEWEEMLDKSGLTDRLRKLSEMQMEGGDLFYSAFSMLKTYPFFNHISHWFLPFDPERRDVVEALRHDTALGMVLGSAPGMCDSDKYSFVLSIDRLPDSHRALMLRQLEESGVNMSQMAASELLPDRSRRRDMIVRYVQDLFRFFRHFRRSAEFADPFRSLINPQAIPALRPDFADHEKMRLLGEFYFKHGHMEEAVVIFRALPPDLTIHQKTGHALQALGRNDEALVEFERAEMLAPDSEWTLRRLARLNRAMGRYAVALDYYEKIDRLAPDSPAVALDMGHCHLQLNQLHEALHCYYKAEMLDETSTKPLRPIAWCAFLNRDFETARSYYDRVMEQLTPAPADYLNMGHLALATGDIRAAINFYKLSAPDPEQLARSLADDVPLLERAEIDSSLIPLILDNIRFENDR